MKTALVTGASRGIGKAIATKLSTMGYNLIINYNKSEQEAKNLAKSLNNAHTYQCDMSDYLQVEKMYSYIKENFSTLDLVVNNAGSSYNGLLQDMGEIEINQCVSTNLLSTIYSSKQAAKIMVTQHNGNIINISSIWGVSGASCESVYSAAKGGIIIFTKALAKELSLSGIRVNCISPGVIKTDMLNCYTENDLNILASETPLQRLGQVEDIANMVEFLSSDKSSFITGENMVIDGGFIL